MNNNDLYPKGTSLGASDNPLLDSYQLPPFVQIKPEHVEPAISWLLEDNRKQIEDLIQQQKKSNKPWVWDSLVTKLEALDDRLNKAWSPVSHMNAVVDTPELRSAYNACIPQLSEYGTEMGQHEGLYNAFLEIKNSQEFDSLESGQQQLIKNTLRDFKLSGISLEKEKQQQFRDISKQLAELTTKFSENVLDATNNWHIVITDKDELTGIPESSLALAKQNAEQKQLDGWLFNLEFPSYFAVSTYADNRKLRQQLYTEFVTRASDMGSNAGKWDNSQAMQQILALRHEKASLLGYKNYAEYSLATKMADSVTEAIEFLEQLADKSLPVATKEFTTLQQFAQQELELNDMQAWDVAWVAEKSRKKNYNLSQDELRPWFPTDQVLAGMFLIVKKLYGIKVKEVDGVDNWHNDVRFFDIFDQDENLRGRFYLDLYARGHKRGGAWMDEAICRRKVKSNIQTPVAYLTCNFNPPVGDNTALLTHDEVVTLFHEFGHGLHHMLTKIDHLEISGINGVAWDAVELPSQFMENWCWQPEALNLIAKHYQTGEPLPEDKFSQLLAAKNFNSGMAMVRQLEFALFDLLIHQQPAPDIYAVLDKVRQKVAVVKPPEFNRFPHSFSHIFAGGYAAGYYSYKWAEVLSADAFSLFEENGIFDHDSGQQFLTHVLEKGGSAEPMELFVKFRGRKPDIAALLRHSGITD